MSWLSEAWQSGEFVPLVSRDCVVELVRVLAYPKFNLTEMEQKAVLGAYLPFTETVHITDPKLTTLPKCRDIDDVKFLVLAHVGKADCLVSGDRDLLELATFTKFRILSPEEFRDRFVSS
jgi:putative PIN family toxin of toxin-antitoxin system